MGGWRGEKPEYKKFLLKTELGPLIISTGNRSTNHPTKNLRHKHQISLENVRKFDLQQNYLYQQAFIFVKRTNIKTYAECKTINKCCIGQFVYSDIPNAEIIITHSS